MIKEILIKEYDTKNQNIANLCNDAEQNCKLLMQKFGIISLSYYDINGKIHKEFKYESLEPEASVEFHIMPGVALEPSDNIDYIAMIKNNFLNSLDTYFLHEYFKHNNLLNSPNFLQYNHDSKKQIIILSHIKNYDVKTIIDASDSWNNVNIATKKIFLISLSIFTFFAAIFYYNSYYVGYIVHGLKESKLKAETESSEKTEFLSNISHELRTPLNAIIGFSEIMSQKSYGDIGNKHYEGYIDNIYSSGKHLLSIINDILDLQKASAAKLNIEFMDVDLNKIATSSLSFLKPRADSSNITLEIKKPQEHTIISADPKRLKQVFLNLLSNAVKFTNENGKVTLEISSDYMQKKAIVKIIDNGIGIKEEDVPRVLSGFCQIDSRLSRKYEGTGIGLPLTKKLVELMNGSFEIRSKLGEGTTVTIMFDFNIDFANDI